MLDEMELYVSKTHISVKNPATMPKIYEDTCRVLANEIKEVYHLCVMLRNVHHLFNTSLQIHVNCMNLFLNGIASIGKRS